MKFIIEQIALCPPNPAKAIQLLAALGLDEWSHDDVVAQGSVFELGDQTNVANLAFNYQASHQPSVEFPAKPIELEVLQYTEGHNWMYYHDHSVSHLGMHVTASELEEFRAKFAALDIRVAQEVNTLSHTNPVIAGKRQYTYCIFDTRDVLGVDLKFIVRKDIAQS